MKTLRTAYIFTILLSHSCYAMHEDISRVLQTIETYREITEFVKPSLKEKNPLNHLLDEKEPWSLAKGKFLLNKKFCRWLLTQRSQIDIHEKIKKLSDFHVIRFEIRLAVPLKTKQKKKYHLDPNTIKPYGLHYFTELYCKCVQPDADHTKFENVAKFLVNNGAQINKNGTHKKWSPLHIAAQYNMPPILKILLKLKGSINNRSHTLHTPLHIAIGYASNDAAMFLIKKGADCTALNGWNRSPLMYAWNNKDYTFLKQVFKLKPSYWQIKNGNEENQVDFAIKRGIKSMVKFFLTHGVNVNLTSDINGVTLLHQAVFWDKPEIVKLLLKHGANPNAQDKAEHDTPMHLAVMTENKKIIQLLLDHKATYDEIKNDDNETPLEYVKRRKNKELISLFNKHTQKELNALLNAPIEIVPRETHAYEDSFDPYELPPEPEINLLNYKYLSTF